MVAQEGEPASTAPGGGGRGVAGSAITCAPRRRSEAMSHSPWIRGAPSCFPSPVGESALGWQDRSLVGPVGDGARARSSSDGSQRECQRTTVSGFTKTRTLDHFDHQPPQGRTRSSVRRQKDAVVGLPRSVGCTTDTYGAKPRSSGAQNRPHPPWTSLASATTCSLSMTLSGAGL